MQVESLKYLWLKSEFFIHRCYTILYTNTSILLVYINPSNAVKTKAAEAICRGSCLNFLFFNLLI